ncbi:MAG: NYN domain-containing protein [Clostridia bacterium]|nr:NYN domain-containing protein [Clostridia bacterium]
MKPLLIVDGYNVIGAWKEPEKKGWSMDESRDQLTRLLQDYSGYAGQEVVLVYDGWQSERKTTTEEQREGIRIVFTCRGETADAYIERLVAQTPKYRQVQVATSDGLEQSQVLSTGAVRMTSRELLRELKDIRVQGLAAHQVSAGIQRHQLEGRLPEDTVRRLEALRRSPIREEEPKAPAKPVPGKAEAKPKAEKTSEKAGQKPANLQKPQPQQAQPQKNRKKPDTNGEKGKKNQRQRTVRRG